MPVLSIEGSSAIVRGIEIIHVCVDAVGIMLPKTETGSFVRVLVVTCEFEKYYLTFSRSANLDIFRKNVSRHVPGQLIVGTFRKMLFKLRGTGWKRIRVSL